MKSSNINSTWKVGYNTIENRRRRDRQIDIYIDNMYRLLLLCILVGISKRVEGFSVKRLSCYPSLVMKRHSFTRNRNIHLQVSTYIHLAHDRLLSRLMAHSSCLHKTSIYVCGLDMDDCDRCTDSNTRWGGDTN